MSIIFQTLQKLNKSSTEKFREPPHLKKDLRTRSFSGKRILNAAAIPSLLLLFVMSGSLLYFTPGSENTTGGKDDSSASYAVANASPVPRPVKDEMRTVLITDEKIKIEQLDADLFVFLPPDSSRVFKKWSGSSAKKAEPKQMPPRQKKSRMKPGFTPTKKDQKSGSAPRMSEQLIVKKIESAIIEGETRRAEVLLEQLAGIKGEDSIYVMKLRAFFYLRTGENRPAVSLLKKVLAGNADDMEAGINMAILEIKARDYTQAKTRLARLKSIYPDNTVISNLLSKLD